MKFDPILLPLILYVTSVVHGVFMYPYIAPHQGKDPVHVFLSAVAWLFIYFVVRQVNRDNSRNKP